MTMKKWKQNKILLKIIIAILQKNNKEELKSQSKENIDEYLISLFGKEIVEKRAIKEKLSHRMG